MKKLLFILPILIIILCATPFALYKDTVGPGASLDAPSPSYWKVNVSLSAGGSLVELSPSDNTQQTKAVAYTDGAAFKGFPFGAYFSSKTGSANSSSSSSVSGWSWLWGAADLLTIGGALYVALWVNRKN